MWRDEAKLSCISSTVKPCDGSITYIKFDSILVIPTRQSDQNKFLECAKTYKQGNSSIKGQKEGMLWEDYELYDPTNVIMIETPTA